MFPLSSKSNYPSGHDSSFCHSQLSHSILKLNISPFMSNYPYTKHIIKIKFMFHFIFYKLLS